ncbi:MAG: hypothetical protein ABIE70_10585 [bacterium]
MKSEMDAMNMDERQRYCWLLANRATIPFIFAGWLAVIVWELSEGNTPWFMIGMIPVLALIRLIWYKFYVRKFG